MKGKMFFFLKNVSEHSNPPDKSAQHVSKNPFRTNYSSIFSSNVQNLMCNNVTRNSLTFRKCFHEMRILFGVGGTHQARPDQSFSFSCSKWQDQTPHQSKKKYEFDDYIFTIPMEVNGKNTTEPEHKDVFVENCMTTYVKTISGKTIRIKCDKKKLK